MDILIEVGLIVIFLLILLMCYLGFKIFYEMSKSKKKIEQDKDDIDTSGSA